MPKTKQLIETVRFGTLEVEENRVVHFPEGILGFPDGKNYVIMEHKPQSPFLWLQSMNFPELAFVLTNPFLIKPDYLEDLHASEQDLMKSENGRILTILAIVTIPSGQVEKMTVNLLGPLVIDVEARTGRQVILANSGYNHRYPLVKP